MFAIESTNSKGWRWISGVVPTLTEAESLIAAISEALRQFHRIVEFESSVFPVFMIEGRGFQFGGLEFILERLASLEVAEDEDHIHFNVYAFTDAFVPEVPGRDEMGRILHWHVTDATLRSPRSEVFNAELASIASDA
jgi:hypothetical protein